MPERPLLFFPKRDNAPKQKKRGGGPKILPISREAQSQRILGRIDALEAQMQLKRAWFQSNAIATTPNTVMVIELAKPIQNFAAAALAVGLPVLGEWDGEEFDAGSEGFTVLDEKGKPKRNQLVVSHVYLSSYNLTAGDEFRRLFDRWRSGHPWPRDGTTPWSHVFDCIRSVRHWDVTDRLRDSGLIEDWQARKAEGSSAVEFEADFWFRPQAAGQRREIESELARLLNRVGGSIKHQAHIEAISYHGVLGQIPINAIGDLEALDSLDFLQFDEIFEVHPVTQAIGRDGGERTLFSALAGPAMTPSDQPPVVGLVDGMPMQNHPDLIGRVLIEDPDGFAQSVPAAERVHGTAMASLILNGDLGGNADRLARPIRARPVLVPIPTLNGSEERFPPDRLAIDTFHRAIVDLVGRDTAARSASTLRVINVSLGDPRRPFLRKMSPWARLLDWLAFEFRILFVVSAGNRKEDLALEISRGTLAAHTHEQIRDAVLQSLFKDQRRRTLLSPGEAINALTVGAIHDDFSQGHSRAGQIDPVSSGSLASPISPLGLGYANAIKPDVLAAGGKQLYREPLVYPPDTIMSALQIQDGKAAPGAAVAAPGSLIAGSPRWYVRGTSVSAALVTRLAAQTYDGLEAMPTSAGAIHENYAAVVLKALVAHTSAWDSEAETILTAMLQSNGVTNAKLKENLSRFLGHGRIRPDRAYRCTDQRATVIGFGELKHGEAHIFRFPWPLGLRAQVEARSLTITLATLLPVASTSYLYRGADVWVAKPGECAALGLNAADRDHNAIQRGTLQHVCYSGSKAADFADGTNLTLQVNCRAVAIDEALLPPVPYALAVSLEVSESSSIPIYEQIEIGLRTQVQLPVA